MYIIGFQNLCGRSILYFKEKSGKNLDDEYYTKLASLLWGEGKNGVSVKDLYKVNKQ